MPQPPLLPQEVLARVVRLSQMNGRSVLYAAAVFAILGALDRDFIGAGGALIVAGAGAMEVHGSTLLTHRDTRGSNWLVGSQLVCLAGLLVYCVVRILIPQMLPMPEWVHPLEQENARQLGLTVPEFERKLYVAVFVLLAVGSVVYQGGLAVYYARRRAAVTRALEEEV